MATSPEDAPLARGSLAGSEEALILPDPPRRTSNSRAVKIAGVTTLACLLLASQVFTAYLVFNQKQQIHTLQRNSERMGKQLTRSSNAPVRRQMPMNSLPLLMDTLAVNSETAKKTLTKLKDPVVSVENQVKDLMQEALLPQFNETFLPNLLSLKQKMNESEWTSFQSWMRFWLIFQMAQHQPPAPTPEPATKIQTKCQVESDRMIGSYKPQCDEQGRFKPMQCWHATGYCWCVDETGATIEGTTIRGRPDCEHRRAPRMMLAPRLMQKTISLKEN